MHKIQISEVTQSMITYAENRHCHTIIVSIHKKANSPFEMEHRPLFLQDTNPFEKKQRPILVYFSVILLFILSILSKTFHLSFECEILFSNTRSWIKVGSQIKYLSEFGIFG